MEKLFVLIDCLGRGGAEKVAVTLANTFSEQGIEVHLLALRHNVGYKIDPKVKTYYMTNTQFAKGYGYSALEFVFGVLWVGYNLYRLSGGGHRLCLSHLSRSNLINIILGILFFNHDAVCVTHNSLGFYNGQGILKSLFSRFFGIALPFAKYTVCVSKRMEVDYRRVFAFRDDSIVTIYNPVILPNVHHQLKQIKISPPNIVHIAMIGRIHPVKRHDLAIAALALLHRKGQRHYHLHIVGDGPDSARISEEVKNKGLSDCVSFHGWVSDTSSILSQCFLSILCSDTEGFPNAIVESLAMGVPVVSTDCVSGPRELISPESDPEDVLPFEQGLYPGRHGVLVRPGDASAIAAAIQYQVERSDYVLQRINCIQFSEYFRASSVATRYRKLFDSCVHRHI